MKIISTDFVGLCVVEPQVFGDQRGHFLETWNQGRYEAAGLPDRFVQDNISFSRRGTLRGLHFQVPPQGKLVSVLEGRVLDVVVDLRKSSPTFGKHFSIELDGESKRQLFVPAGFAHGFSVMSETALFHYKCTELYNPQGEGTLLWNDPALGIDWKNPSPILSEKDKRGVPLKDLKVSFDL